MEVEVVQVGRDGTDEGTMIRSLRRASHQRKSAHSPVLIAWNGDGLKLAVLAAGALPSPASTITISLYPEGAQNASLLHARRRRAAASEAGLGGEADRRV